MKERKLTWQEQYYILDLLFTEEILYNDRKRYGDRKAVLTHSNWNGPKLKWI